MTHTTVVDLKVVLDDLLNECHIYGYLPSVDGKTAVILEILEVKSMSLTGPDKIPEYTYVLILRPVKAMEVSNANKDR